MEKMLFTSQQPDVTITALPDGKSDVTVLSGDEVVVLETEGNPEGGSTKTMMFQYDGNCFRTVYDLTEEDILADLEKYLNYTAEEEPSLEQLQHDNELIDSYTLELMEGGLL